MSTPQQFAANQANAQLSTGPRTEEGKPNEDTAAYERHVAYFFRYYKPAGDEETAIVQRMADTRWRLDRCANLESNLYALGRVGFKELFPDESPEARSALIQAHTFRAYQKEFRNLNIQEGRLERTFTRDYARLTELQDARLQQEKEEYERALQLGKAAVAYSASIREGKPFDPSEFGFEFSTVDITAFIASQRSRAV
jgi:hypothetical protein